MVAIASTLREDLYVVYAGTNPDTNLPVIHAYLNPLVKWIWFGGGCSRPGNDSRAAAQSAGGYGAFDFRCRQPRSPIPGGTQAASISYSARSQLPDRHE